MGLFRPVAALVWLISNLILGGKEAYSTGKQEFLSVQELYLKPYQEEVLKADLPAQDLYWEGQSGLWILGQTSLWHWKLVGHKLSRLRLLQADEEKQESLCHLLIKDEAILVASQRHLFVIELKPFKVIKLSLPQQPAGETSAPMSFGFSQDDKEAYWLTRAEVWAFAWEDKSLSLWQTHPPLQAGDLPLLQVADKKLWLLRANELLRYDYAEASPSWKKHLAIQDSLLGINPLPQGFLVHSRYAALVLDKQGEIQKTLPVEGDHRLVGVHATGKQHTYLLHDRFIETHSLKEQISRYGKLAIGRVKKAGPMKATHNLVAIVLDGQPRVFQWEGHW